MKEGLPEVFVWPVCSGRCYKDYVGPTSDWCSWAAVVSFRREMPFYFVYIHCTPSVCTRHENLKTDKNLETQKTGV